jgi:hypothetical protein
MNKTMRISVATFRLEISVMSRMSEEYENTNKASM